MPVPQGAQARAGSGPDRRDGVDAHGGAVPGVVRGPAGVSVGGEGDPGVMRGVGHLLREAVAEQRGQRRIVKVVEDEADLGGVAGAEAPVEGGRLPGELVDVGGAGVAGARLGEADGRRRPVRGASGSVRPRPTGRGRAGRGRRSPGLPPRGGADRRGRDRGPSVRWPPGPGRHERPARAGREAAPGRRCGPKGGAAQGMPLNAAIARGTHRAGRSWAWRRRPRESSPRGWGTGGPLVHPPGRARRR